MSTAQDPVATRVAAAHASEHTLPADARAAIGLALIESATQPVDIPRQNRIFVNRQLHLDRIELVGFDMDYTLALYNQPRIEELSMRATLHKLVTNRGYPKEILSLEYDPALAVRGLVIDRLHGNIFKPDRYGTPGRALHGRHPIDRPRLAELYNRERMRLSQRRYAWIDSLFALPEAVLYACLVEYFDSVPTTSRPAYSAIWDHIRECIDLAHRDGSIKSVVSNDFAQFVVRDPDLAETLHKFRSSGKRLFLLTNSAWDYTSEVMRFLLDGALPAYPSWRSYFDVVIVSAGKPEFFTEERRFVELDADGQPMSKPQKGPFVRGRVYAGGNLKDFQEKARAGGDRVLFVGDHIYGDMLRSRKSTNWRTAMVLQELEHEIASQDRMKGSLAQLDQLDARIFQLDTELNERQTVMRSLQKLEELQGPGLERLAAAKHTVKEALERQRAERRQLSAQYRAVESEVDLAFNPHWGPMFREGHEISKFGEQVEAYACLYTSRVSNFRYYSPMWAFRAPRHRMPHER